MHCTVVIPTNDSHSIGHISLLTEKASLLFLQSLCTLQWTVAKSVTSDDSSYLDVIL